MAFVRDGKLYSDYDEGKLDGQELGLNKGFDKGILAYEKLKSFIKNEYDKNTNRLDCGNEKNHKLIAERLVLQTLLNYIDITDELKIAYKNDLDELYYELMNELGEEY